MEYTILTAANDAYINTCMDFISSYTLDYANLIVYDLGFNEDNLHKIQELQVKYNFQLKIFNFRLYPEHVDLIKYNGLNCSYAFKPIIIYNEANEQSNKNKVIIWMDSANRFNGNSILEMYNLSKKQGIYSPISALENTIESIELNNHQIVTSYGITNYEHTTQLKSISANIIGIDYTNNAGFYILNKWYTDSLNKNQICPEGTNRNNNRQDQTILSILIYLYEKNNNIIFNKSSVGVTPWVKKDQPKIDNNIYKPFKLIEKNSRQQLAIILCENIHEAIKTYANRKNFDVNELLEKYIVCN